MQKVESRGLRFLGADGRYHIIYGVPLKQRRELRYLLHDLSDRLTQSQIKAIDQLYDDDPEFCAIADKCLELAKIDPQWVDIDQLTEFLLPHRDGEGQPQRPKLEQINFSQVAAGGKSATYEEAVAGLWAKLGEYETALRAAGYEPGEQPGWEELAAIAEEHSMLIDPKLREKKEMDGVAEQMMAAIASGDGLPGFASGGKIASGAEIKDLLR